MCWISYEERQMQMICFHLDNVALRKYSLLKPYTKIRKSDRCRVTLMWGRSSNSRHCIMTCTCSLLFYMHGNETSGQQAHVHKEGYSMLSSHIEWTWVHWFAAKPSHLATLLSCTPVLLLFPCHWHSLLSYFPQHYNPVPQPLTSSLHVCYSHPDPCLYHFLPPSQLSTTDLKYFEFGSRLCACVSFVFVSTKRKHIEKES